MPPKALSNGTLALRFMQRKTVAEAQVVKLEAAKVADDAEWDVGPKMRAAWGLGMSSGAGPSKPPPRAVIYEASYLPFMFGDDSVSDEGDDLTVKASTIKASRGGRWRALSIDPSPEEINVATTDGVTSVPTGSLPSSISIFSFDNSRPLLAPTATSSNTSQSSKKERTSKRKLPEVEKDYTGSGALHLAGSPTNGDPEHPPWNGFMRPAGVDIPITITSGVTESSERKKKRKQKLKEPIDE